MKKITDYGGTLYHGDCFKAFPLIKDQSVDLILCDLPYGVTDCDWDTVPPLEAIWREYKRVIKPKGAIVLTATLPFASDLIAASKGWFRYDVVWDKVNRKTGYANANKMPLRQHELVLVFYKSLPTYHPQFGKGDPYKASAPARKVPAVYAKGGLVPQTAGSDGRRFPTSIIKIDGADSSSKGSHHPTAKPVPLFEYLIKTYSNEGDLVLDNTAGGGTTAIAAINTSRNYICVEMNDEFFAHMTQRVRVHWLSTARWRRKMAEVQAAEDSKRVRARK